MGFFKRLAARKAKAELKDGFYIPYAELDAEKKAMADDENPDRRARAAIMGWGIDRLADDGDDRVADAAWKYMEVHGIAPYAWIG